MEIRRQHENGTLLEVVKTYEEMTNEEKALLIIPATSNISDYATFRIDRNKKNQVTRVSGERFSKKKSEELKKNRGNDVVDMLVGIENIIENKNVDADKAYAAAFERLNII